MLKKMKLSDLLKHKIVLITLACVLGMVILIVILKLSYWLIAALLTCLAVGYAFKMLSAWKSGGSLMKALNNQVTDEHQLEVSALQEKMKEAISKLRASGAHSGYRGTAALYALPWYMIIGPSAAGKSTLLRNSNLNFPYSVNDHIDIKGFAGTRNCDWWFADEAIILDTAGRYTIDDADKPEWLAFLKLLRKHRPRAPINGVIVTLSLDEILGSDKKALTHHCQLIRKKLDELNQQLGIIIPVQLVVTKCDLLRGFSQFFRELSVESREQAWGVQFADNDFKTGLTSLVKKISDWRIHKLGMSTQLEHKHDIMVFPVEFEEATQKVLNLLEMLTQKNHYQEQPVFEGVYFTSALQEKSIDSSSHSYFIKDLFRKIIFQQKTTVKNAREYTIYKITKVAATTLGLGLCLLSGVLLQLGYEKQTDLYAKQQGMLNSLGGVTSYDQLSGLLKIYQHYSSLKAIDNQHLWRFMLGFNSIKTQIKQNEALYSAYFSPLLLRPAFDSLEKLVSDETKEWSSLSKEDRAHDYSKFYDRLKTYLMMGSQDKLEPMIAARNLNAGWEYYLQSMQPAIPLSVSAAPIESMFQGYVSLLQGRRSNQEIVTINPQVVKAARAALYMSPDAQLLYQHLVSRGTQELGLISLKEMLSGKDQGLIHNSYSMPKMFTKSAFEISVLPMMKEIAENAGTGDWVLQDGTADSIDKQTQQKWVNELRVLYFNDYVDHWMGWLAGNQVNGFHSLDDAAGKLLRLAPDDGPLQSVIKTFGENMDWSVPELARTKTSISQILEQDTMKDYLKHLSVIQTDIAALASSSDPLRDAEVYARKVFAETGQTSLASAMNSVHGLSNLGQDAKVALTSFLKSPVDQSWRSVLNASATHIQTLWDAEVVASYNQTLRGKFPFAKNSIEVAVDDVTNFFNPNDGVLSQFHNTVLRPYLKPVRGGWVEQQWMGQGIGFSASFLNTLTQGEQITHALFKAGSGDPKFTFYIQPVAMPGIEEVIFDSNGQEYRYRNEPEEWRRFTWPGEASQIGARLYASANQNKYSAEIEHHGLWGLFHLLSEAKFVKQGGTQYMTEWKLQDRTGQILSVKMKIKADKQSNVLDPRSLTQFKLPDNIKNTQTERV